jgi:hypothetical protein
LQVNIAGSQSSNKSGVDKIEAGRSLETGALLVTGSVSDEQWNGKIYISHMKGMSDDLGHDGILPALSSITRMPLGQHAYE